jgi:hypothetical protein
MTTASNVRLTIESIHGLMRLISSRCLIAFIALSFQSCPNPEVDKNLSKAILMKYSHLANVKAFQDSSAQFQGVPDNSFWAIFEICILDVQGSALTGVHYDTGKFFIDEGSLRFPSAPPGNVNSTFGTQPANHPQVVDAVHHAFALTPATQFFPKQFYPNLKYRIAIFVSDDPGYHGDSMTLKYDGQPEVAALVQNVSPQNPIFIPFYGPGTSRIEENCP